MEFDLIKFINNLRRKALTKQEALNDIHDEIRAAENQKVNFLDQAEENPDFYKYISSQVDSYVTYLKVLHNDIDPQQQRAPDEQVYQTDEAIINCTLQLIKQLEVVEKSRLNQVKEEHQRTNLNNTDTGT